MMLYPRAGGVARPGRRTMRKTDLRAAAVDGELASARLYRILATAFSYPEPWLAEGVGRDLAALTVALSSQSLSPRIAGSLRRAAQSWRRVPLESLRVEYSRLFLGSALVPMREGGYGDGLRFAGQPVDLADLNGFYLAFGFGPPSSAASPPDHLGTELEFMSLLHLKIAYALQRRQAEQARITRMAMARFVEDHLGRWIAAFRLALRDADAAAAYQSAAGLLACAVETDAKRLGASPSPAAKGTGVDPVGLESLMCPLAEAGPKAPDAMPHAMEPFS